MQVRTIGRFSIIGVASIGVFAGLASTAVASDYPPSETTPTTIVDYPPSETTPTTVVAVDPPSGSSPTVSTIAVEVLAPVGPAASTTTAAPTTSTRTAAVLPSTGRDSDGVVKVAAAAAIAGVGLVAVARRRRRVTPTA